MYHKTKMTNWWILLFLIPSMKNVNIKLPSLFNFLFIYLFFVGVLNFIWSSHNIHCILRDNGQKNLTRAITWIYIYLSLLLHILEIWMRIYVGTKALPSLTHSLSNRPHNTSLKTSKQGTKLKLVVNKQILYLYVYIKNLQNYFLWIFYIISLWLYGAWNAPHCP